MTEKLKKIKAERKKPVNLIAKDDFLFSHEYQKYINQSKIKTLRNVYISESKLKKFKYFRFNTRHWRMNPLKIRDKIVYLLQDFRDFFFNRRKCEIIKVKQAIWAIDSRSYQYFHWFTDTLQRVEAANSYHDKGPVLLLPEFENFNYIKDSLNMLGIKSYVLDKDKEYLIEKLILSERVSPAGNYRKNLINKISDNFIKNKNLKNEDFYKKVWVSRQKANKRRIANFDEIKPILEKYNFAVIDFEDFSLKDNINRAHNCQVIGGVHGAGLTNMIFMNKKSKVIEIRSDGDDTNNCFFSLASDMEHDYFYFLANPTSNNFYETDLHVDPVLFENFLKINEF